VLKPVELLHRGVQEIGVAAEKPAVAAAEQVDQLAGRRRVVVQFGALSSSPQEVTTDGLPVEVRAVLKQPLEGIGASTVGELVEEATDERTHVTVR
jgi:hypothetical protein